jgi:hypothetical protein
MALLIGKEILVDPMKCDRAFQSHPHPMLNHELYETIAIDEYDSLVDSLNECESMR